MATLREHLDRIHREVPITSVLSDLGYAVRPDGGLREQQFSCDLHGDGRDSKPSARVYPDSSSWYCFACSKARDAVDTLQAKRPDISLQDAIRAIERRYKLPDLPWEDDRPKPAPDTVRKDVGHVLDPGKTYEDELKVLKSTLEWITQERVLPMHKTVSFWEALDQVAFKVEKNLMPEKVGRQVVAAIQERVDSSLVSA